MVNSSALLLGHNCLGGAFLLVVLFSFLINFILCAPEEQFLLLLGKRVDDPVLENRVDWQVKKFLCKSWTKRKPVMDAINRQFGTQYGIYNVPTAA